MKKLRVLSSFFSLPRREKIIVVVLTVIFVVSTTNFIVDRITFPVRSEKGVFAEGFVGHIRNPNPLFQDFSDADRDLSKLIFSGLIKYDPVARNFVPDLAEKFERSSNGLEYTFTLRENARWHDGTPVTVDDVIFTFHDVIQDPGFRNPILKNTFEGIGVASKAPQTIAFTLTKPNSYFLSHLTIGLIPKHLFIDTPIANLDRNPSQKKIIGSGPYAVSGIKLDEDGDVIDLTAYSEYYGQKPTLEKIRLFTFPDEESLIEERSALHAISKLKMESPSAQTLSQDMRFGLHPYTLNQYTALFLNTDHPFLKEKRVRQSMYLSLDKRLLVSPGEKRIDTIGLSEQSENPNFAANPELANKTLDELGFQTGPEGFRLNKGEKISLTLLTLENIPGELLENIRNSWQSLGIQITIKKESMDEFTKRVSERGYDLLLIRQNLGYNRDVYPLFHSSQIAGGVQGNRTGQNFANFRSFRTDGLTEALRKEKDPTDKEKLFRELSSIISDEVPVIFLSTPEYAYALDKRASEFPGDASLDYHADRLNILPYLSFQNL